MAPKMPSLGFGLTLIAGSVPSAPSRRRAQLARPQVMYRSYLYFIFKVLVPQRTLRSFLGEILHYSRHFRQPFLFHFVYFLIICALYFSFCLFLFIHFLRQIAEEFCPVFSIPLKKAVPAGTAITRFPPNHFSLAVGF